MTHSHSNAERYDIYARQYASCGVRLVESAIPFERLQEVRERLERERERFVEITVLRAAPPVARVAPSGRPS